MQVCSWVKNQPEFYLRYHNEEWGVPKYDDRELFELLVLEGFQAGLAWVIVLKKREAFRVAYDNFDVQKVASYDDKKVAKLLENTDIIRSKSKIISSIYKGKLFAFCSGVCWRTSNWRHNFT